MRTRILFLTAAALLIAAQQAQAQRFYALPYGTGGTYNLYEIRTGTSNWSTAQTGAAATLDPANGTVLGNLVRIDSAAENLAIGRLMEGNSGPSWIGANDITTEGTWVWSNNNQQFWQGTGGGSVVNGLYNKWAGGEPNDSGANEDAATIDAGGTGNWNDLNAGNAQASVREWIKNSVTKPTVPATNASVDPVTGKFYERSSDTMSWDQARVAGASRSVNGVAGNLVAIDNAAENYVVQQLGGGDRWIGFHDSGSTSQIDGVNLGATEGTFRWVNGQAITYTNWNGGEPNDGGGEDAAVMNAGGGWNDLAAGASLGQGNNQLQGVFEYNVTPNPLRTLGYLERRGTGSFAVLDSLAEAKTLLGLPNGNASIASQISGSVYGISFVDPQNIGGFQNAYAVEPFLGNTAADDDNFAVKANGYLNIPSAGTWTFAITHDDFVEITVNGVTQTSGTCCGNVDLFTFAGLPAGPVPFNLFWVEQAGGGVLQVFTAQGNPAFNTNVYRSLGDGFSPGGIGIAALSEVPEPTSIAIWSLLGVAGAAFGLRTWRKKNTAKAA